MLLYTVIAIAC